MSMRSGNGLVCDGSNLRGLILDATSRKIKQSEEANAEAAETERGRMIDLSTVDVSMALRVSGKSGPAAYRQKVFSTE
ncbi:hypothetical protein ABZX51_002210 [Aspergillus tubingensis]